MKKYAQLLLLLLLLTSISSAQNIFTSAGADFNWSNLNNWSLGHAPQIGENIVIPADETCYLNVNSVLVANVTVEPGAQILSNTTVRRYLNLSGSLVNDGIFGNDVGTLDGISLSFNATSGTQSLSGSGIFNMHTIRKNGIGASSISIQQNIALRGNGTILFNNTASACTLSVNSGLTVTFGGTGTVISTTNMTYTLNNSTFVFSASGDQVLPALSFYNLTLAGSGVKTVTGVTITNVFTMGGIATANGTPTIAGNLVYAGTSAQLTGSEMPASIANVIINNPNGVTLTNDKTITGSLVFSAGNLSSGGFALTLGPTGILSGEADARHLIGNLLVTRDIGLGSQNFGNSGFTIAAGTDLINNVTLSRVTGSALVVGIYASILRRYVFPNGVTFQSPRNVSFQFFPSEDNGKNFANIALWQNKAGNWDTVAGYMNSGSLRNINNANITDLSGTFTATDNSNPLPVELTSFNASFRDKSVILYWTTATEVNNYGFDLERAGEDKSFSKVGFIEGAGNSNSTKTYSYTDKTVSGSGKYYYRLKQIDKNGDFKYLDEIEVNFSSQMAFELDQNYPNPFNPSTSIKFSIPIAAHVTLSVFNMLGQRVAVLANEFMGEGNYTKSLNGSNLASGTYIYTLQAGDQKITKKMLLLK